MNVIYWICIIALTLSAINLIVISFLLLKRLQKIKNNEIPDPERVLARIKPRKWTFVLLLICIIVSAIFAYDTWYQKYSADNATLLKVQEEKFLEYYDEMGRLEEKYSQTIENGDLLSFLSAINFNIFKELSTVIFTKNKTVDGYIQNISLIDAQLMVLRRENTISNPPVLKSGIMNYAVQAIYKDYETTILTKNREERNARRELLKDILLVHNIFQIIGRFCITLIVCIMLWYIVYWIKREKYRKKLY